MSVSREGAVGRAVQKVAGTKAFATVGSRIFPPLDRLAGRLTGGRVILSQSLVPSLMLTTTGRKSGQPRSSPLATLPTDDGFLVVGSNFGKDHHPAWTGNLVAEPKATVVFKGETIAVTARLLDADEKRAVWPELLRLWPNYDRYRERSGRDIRVFLLEPQSR